MKDLEVITAMLSVEFFEAGANTISKAAMKRGMNEFVFVMYSNAFAVIFLLPFCFIFYWKRAVPSLTWRISGQLWILGFLSCSVQMLRFFGINYSSPTLASAMSDLIPAFTFVLAIFCRMEKLDCKADSTLAKLFGTIVSIAGALTITLCKGLPLINPYSPYKPHSLTGFLPSSQFNWIFGALLLVAQSFLLSVAFILQTRVIREYPTELIVVIIRVSIVALLSAPASLISESDPKALRLQLNMDLVAILCSAIFVNAFKGMVHIWVMGKKGPVHGAMFKPFQMVFVVVMGITFLGDTLYLGSVVGATIIVIGFYAVIWGKSQEEKKVEKDCEIYDSSEASSPEVPLLKNKTTEP